VVANCLPLQLAWAREQAGFAMRVRRPSRLARILRAQISAFDPDVVYAQDLSLIDEELSARLRDDGRLLVAQVGSGPPPEQVVRRYDLVMTSFPHFVERYRALGVDAEYFAIGFDERVLERIEDAPRGRYDAVFVGTIHPPEIHAGGMALLERAAAAGVEFWGRADALPEGSPIRARHHGPAWGLDMYRVLAGARIAVNRHGDIAEGNANNMRLFEATGVGSLLLTEAAPNLPELFDPGREVVTYQGADDLVEKITHYVEHDDERTAIARAGQARTLRDHTYAQRMRQLADILEKRLGSR
jgi:hypothetical protein